MLRKEKIRDATKWELLIGEYESRKISCRAFCELHNISRGSLYKWRRYYLSINSDKHEESFIRLEVASSRGFKSIIDVKIESPIQISSKLGITVACLSGCKRSKLTTIIEVLNVTE